MGLKDWYRPVCPMLWLVLSSRMACKRCRRLKVKCNEGYPCKKCEKRGVKCVPHKSKQRVVSGNPHALIMDEEKMIAYVAKYWETYIAEEVFPN